MCLNPIKIPNPNKASLYREIEVSCRKCLECRNKHQNDWLHRMQNQVKISQSSYFVTLTYNPENLPYTESGNDTLDYKDVTNFIKRLRYRNKELWKEEIKIRNIPERNWKSPKIKYYRIGEYGGHTLRPHYHLIIFNLNKVTANHLMEIWGKGNIKLDLLNDNRIKYIVGYLKKEDYYKTLERIPKDVIKPRASMSKGIGENYVEIQKQYHLNHMSEYIKRGSKKQQISAYYKNKIFNSDQLEKLTRDRKKEIAIKEKKLNAKLKKQGIKDIESYKQTLIQNRIDKEAKKIRQRKNGV